MNKSIKTTVTSDVKRVTRYEYSDAAIRKVLGLPEQDTASNRIRIFMRVPDGGDWSGSDLEVSNHKSGDHLIVEITETTHKETEE